MRRLIHHKLGKMFSAPSHAVKSSAGDLGRVDQLPLWGAEKVRTGPGSHWHGSAESAETPEEVENVFCRFVFVCDGECSGGWFAGLNTVDQTVWENKHTLTETRTLSLVVEYFPPWVVHMWAKTHTVQHEAVPPPRHGPYSKQTAGGKLGSTSVSSTLMSWPKVMDRSLLQLQWGLPGFF